MGEPRSAGLPEAKPKARAQFECSMAKTNPHETQTPSGLFRMASASVFPACVLIRTLLDPHSVERTVYERK